MRKNTVLSGITIAAGIAAMFMLQACPNGKMHIGCGGPMRGSEPTTMMLVFTNTNNHADADTATWTNMNANGNGAPPVENVKAHVTLSANASYHVQVYFLNLSVLPGSSSYDVTPGVAKESSSYLVCFGAASIYGNLGNNLGWAREDMDNSPVPMQLGLVDSFWTGADSTCGILQATLHHQYKVKTGDCNPGYVDIQALDTVYISPGKG